MWRDECHFDTQEHIDKFNNVCKIDIKKCFENVFLTINCKFLDMRYNYIYIFRSIFQKTHKRINLKKH